MAKGFIIHVENSDAPQKVHKNIEGAYKEAYRLSELCPDKIVTLSHIVKRVKNGKSIGSHLPDDSPGITDTDQLVCHTEIANWKPKQRKERVS